MKSENNRWESTQNKNKLYLAMWTGIWLCTTAFATFGPLLLWDKNPLFSVLGIALNTIIGLKMVLVNIKYINGLDELHKKIHTEAMAITLGIAVVLGLSYSMLDVVDVIPFDAEISHLVIIIGITYLIGTIIGNAKYK